MVIHCTDDKIRYTGRWNVTETTATSTANGSYFEFVFHGENAVIRFDLSHTVIPRPHVYVCVDDGARVEVPLEPFMRIFAEEGEHRVCVIMKSSVETQNRWCSPIEAAVSLVNIEAEEFAELPEDTRPIIEFIGDSITEGIAIDIGYVQYGDNRDMVYWDDATAGYAWLTAEKLNYRPVIMGYGCLGLTRGGAGNVPLAEKAYPYYSEGYPIHEQKAAIIVVNLGTNDRNSDADYFIQKYIDFLYVVRMRNPEAKIVALTPFSGCLATEIQVAVEAYNAEKDDRVGYVNATGWIDPEPLHPTRNGHKTVSEKLSQTLKGSLLWEAF